MNLPSVHPRSWTIGDLEAELKRIGACLRWMRCEQNLNWKHNPGKDNWWHVTIGPALDRESWRHGSAWGPTLEIAIAKAMRNYVNWVEPDFGERVEQERLNAKRKISGDDLLKELGL